MPSKSGIQLRRSHFSAEHLVPRSYSSREVCRLLGNMNRTRLNKHFARFIRRYGCRRNPQYNADDVEALARNLAWFDQQREAGVIPSHIPPHSVIMQLNPPGDFQPGFIEEIRKRDSIPPSYLIRGVVKQLNYYDRRNLYRSDLLDHIRVYQTAYRRLFDASDVRLVARAVRAFEIEQTEQGLHDRERKPWIAKRVQQAKNATRDRAYSFAGRRS